MGYARRMGRTLFGMWMWGLSGGAAWAGAVSIRTAGPCTVALDGVDLVDARGPGWFVVSDLPDGDIVLTITRGKDVGTAPVQLPAGGTRHLEVPGSGPLPTAATAPPDANDGPTLVLRPTAGQRFGVVLDARRLAVVGPRYPVAIEGLRAGEHPVEVRSGDWLTVWARGALVLEAAGAVALAAADGRPLVVEGPPGAFVPR